MARTPDGFARMKALAVETPGAFLDGYRTGREVAWPATAGTSRAYAAGMGGSGIVADLARSLVQAETALDLTVVRAPDLPRAVDRHAHVLLTSYSGNTWETLRAYDAAGRARAHRTVLTSGGELAERAEHDEVPVVRVPPGLPPRAAIGHLLGSTLGLLDAFFPESNERRVAQAVDAVRSAIGPLAALRGTADDLAGRIGARLPFVYAEASFVPLARRWKTQVEENAKRLAFFDEVPELFHNALVGWDALPRKEAVRYAVLLLEWTAEDPQIRSSVRHFERLLRGQGVRVLRVPLEAEDRVEALLGGVVLGDLVSLHLARRRHVDPWPVDAITRFKRALSS